MQFRAAGYIVADGVHLGGSRVFAEDRKADARVLAGDDSRQHQRHARLRCIGSVGASRWVSRCAKEVSIGDACDVDAVMR